jgi:hypothetical protein
MVTSTRAFAGNPEFRDLCRKFRALEARKAVDEASANFEQAHLIRDARVRLKVPVAAICDSLDLSPQSINTYRNVAERIDEKLFRQLIEARRADGLALFPWSVIAQVARLAGEEEREELIKSIRLRGWRTRDVQGYIAVERSDAAARINGESRAGRSGAQVGGVTARSDPDEIPRDGVSSVVGDLATRMEMLLKDVSRTAPPTYILVAVADVASRMIAEAARASDRECQSRRELRTAREALTRCAAIASDVRNSIQRRLAKSREEVGAEGAVPLRPDSGSRPMSSV